MPISMNWYVEDYVLHVQESGILTLHDLQCLNQEVRSVLNTLSRDWYPVHLILDHSRLDHRPPDMVAIRDCISIFTHPALGWTVIVTPDLPASHFLGETLRRLANARVEVVADLGQAEGFLLEQDERLR